MNETSDTNIEPTTPVAEKVDSAAEVVKTPDKSPDAIEPANVSEVLAVPTIEPNNDAKSEEIKIVAVVASASVDEQTDKSGSVEQEETAAKPIESTEPKPEASTSEAKSSSDRNETRLISLDTIIRKGLNEQMPMTAKDIDNIVPNAIKQQQDASLKQSEKLASEQEFALVYESSDDYDSANDDKFEEDLVDDANTTAEKDKIAVAAAAAAETKVSAANETPLENKTPSDVVKEPEPEPAPVETANAKTDKSNGSTASDHSFEDFGSESSDSSNYSTDKKRKRRKSTTTPRKVKDDANQRRAEVGETGADQNTEDDPGIRLNRRGKPRKSYDESDSEQVKKKVGRKLKMQRFSGAKRAGARVS